MNKKNSRSCPKTLDDTREEDTRQTKADRSDFWNIVLLVFLYVFQGTFGGLLHAIPLVVQENGASYGEQVEFHKVDF
jgi:hypothetical protein